MAFKPKQPKIGLSDPGVVRSVQNTLNRQSLIAAGNPTIEEGNKVVLPNSTLRTTATTVGVLTSANNQAGDTVTIYTGANSIYVSAIDQTVKSFIINGVTQIIPGDNIYIDPAEGTGVVTISASSSIAPTKIQNGESYANIEEADGNLVISANGKLWTFGTDGNITLPPGNDISINYANGTPYGSTLPNGFSNGTSNGSIPTANGNINFSVNGNANVVVITGTGMNVAGTANITGLANVGGNLTVTGTSNLNNVSNVIIAGGSNGQVLTTNGSGNLSWTSVNVSGFSNGTSSGSIPTANGNINFSVGGNSNVVVVTGTGANITGTLAVTGTSNLNAVGNVIITGGSNGQVLTTNGAGNLSWTTVIGSGNSFSNGTSNGSIPTANGNINFSVGGNANILVVTGTGANITGTLAVTGTSNLNAVGNVTITGGSNGQVLTTNGNGNLSWSSVVASATGNGTSGITIPTANGNVLIGSGGNTVVVITPTGANVTGNLGVSGNGNIGGNLGVGGNITANGNITGNYILGNGAFLTGIATLSNGNSNVRIAENGNIALSVSGNANIFTFTGNSANFSKPVGLDSTLTVAGNTLFNSNVNMGGRNINNLAEPNVGTDAATKFYVDTFASGLSVKQSANAATTANLDVITGGTAAYNNGTSGVGANLTITGGTLTAIDGVSLTANMRLLIKNEANQAWNGIYVYNNNTVITRSTDFDVDAEVLSGSFLFVTTGSTLADTAWVQTTDSVVVGTSNIVFSQFSGAGSFQAANGINLVGSTFSANTDGVTTAISGGNIVVKASANLTTPNIGNATGNSLTLTGNGLVSAANVNVSANITAVNLAITGVTNLNAVGNVKITGGTSGQFIKTDGNGNLSFGDPGATGGSLTRFITANSILVAPTNLDTFSSTAYRSVIYQLQISSGTDYEATMISLLQNNTNVYISQYSDVTSNVPLATFDASLAANVVTVTFTPVNAVTTVTGIATLLAV